MVNVLYVDLNDFFGDGFFFEISAHHRCFPLPTWTLKPLGLKDNHASPNGQLVLAMITWFM